MKMNDEIRWAGRVYRHANPDGEGSSGDAGAEGAGDSGSGADGGDAGSGDAGASGSGDGDADGSSDGDPGGAGSGASDWRERVVGYAPDDQKDAYENFAGRFNDEAAFVQAAIQANQKLRAGEISSGLPEDPTDEQLANWREAHDVPIDGEYDLTSTELKRELSDLDREMMAPVMEIAHGHNISNEALNDLMQGWMAETDKVVEQMNVQDNLDAQEFHRQAKEAWGADYQINMNRAVNQINLLPEAIRDAFKQARMPDGRGIMNSPEVMTWLVGIDRTITPLDPMKGGTESTIADARQIVAKAKERMRDDSVGWHKDQDAQREFMQAQSMIDQFEGSQ